MPEPLWLAVEERLAYVNKTFGPNGRKGGLMNVAATASPYIFSGLLKCGVCGANYTIVSGQGHGHKNADPGCPSHVYRGTCSNNRRMRRATLEAELLAKLQNSVLSDAAIDYCPEKLATEVEKRESALDAATQAMLQRKIELESRLRNLCVLVADGTDSPALRTAIVESEAELSFIAARALGNGKGSLQQENARPAAVREGQPARYPRPAHRPRQPEHRAPGDCQACRRHRAASGR